MGISVTLSRIITEINLVQLVQILKTEISLCLLETKPNHGSWSLQTTSLG